MSFKEELQALGAREFQIVALSADEERGRAVIAEAERRGVAHVIPYAITLFDDETFNAATGPSKPLLKTNVHVDVKCDHCGGDRFVFVTDDPGPYGETVAPCKVCNAEADTGFWRVDGTRARTVAR